MSNVQRFQLVSFSLIWHLVSLSQWVIGYFEHVFCPKHKLFFLQARDLIACQKIFESRFTVKRGTQNGDGFIYIFLFFVGVLLFHLNLNQSVKLFMLFQTIWAWKFKLEIDISNVKIDSELAFFFRIHIWKSASQRYCIRLLKQFILWSKTKAQSTEVSKIILPLVCLGGSRRRVKSKLDMEFEYDFIDQKLPLEEGATVDEAGVTTCSCGRSYTKRKNYTR